MKAIRFGEAEAEAIREDFQFRESFGAQAFDGLTPAQERKARAARKAVLAKLDKARAPSTNVAVKPIEDALIAAAPGKVVALLEGHAQASVQAGRLGVTPEKAYLVGKYLERTKWLTGPFTLLDVLMKWPTYYSKAEATQPPPSAPAGFGGASAVTGQGTTREGQGTTGGRRTPGFR